MTESPPQPIKDAVASHERALSPSHSPEGEGLKERERTRRHSCSGVAVAMSVRRAVFSGMPCLSSGSYIHSHQRFIKSCGYLPDDARNFYKLLIYLCLFVRLKNSRPSLSGLDTGGWLVWVRVVHKVIHIFCGLLIKVLSPAADTTVIGTGSSAAWLRVYFRFFPTAAQAAVCVYPGSSIATSAADGDRSTARRSAFSPTRRPEGRPTTRGFTGRRRLDGQSGFIRR